jgi:hypothetical protein
MLTLQDLWCLCSCQPPLLVLSLGRFCQLVTCMAACGCCGVLACRITTNLNRFCCPALQDLDQLLMFYPYLKNPFSYDCSTEPHEQNRAPYTPGAASAIQPIYYQQLSQRVHYSCSTGIAQ